MPNCAILSVSTRLLVFSTCLAIFTGNLLAREPERDDARKRAPSLNGGLEWINSEKPIALAELRGKFVILDFWTYCCINCLQTLPDLKKLERAYPNRQWRAPPRTSSQPGIRRGPDSPEIGGE